MWLNRVMPVAADMLPDDIDALRAALAVERAARREAEARASGAEAMVAHLKLLIAKRTWLADVLARIGDHKASRLDALLPWK